MAKEINVRKLDVREDKNFEVQWYDDNGDNYYAVQLDTLEDLALYLARRCWGVMRFKNNPTVYYNGKPFCRYEYTEL